MGIRISGIILLLLSGLPSLGWSLDGITCELAVYQRDPATDAPVLLHRDTTELLIGIPRRGGLLPFSLDLELESRDTSRALFSVHLVTVGQPPVNYAQRYRVEYGLPSRLGPFEVKPGTKYELGIIPLGPISVDTSDCGWLHSRGEQFRFDPSAHFDIHYAPQTLGDFQWAAAKGVLEDAYDRFDAVNHFTLPGKSQVFLCPCECYSVLWDRRFMLAVDPARNSAFAIVNPGQFSFDPYVAWHSAALRHYGYAPPFLAEGFANHLSLAVWDMRRLLLNKPTISPGNFLDTRAYLVADPVTADRVAATFAEFLVRVHGIEKLLEVYRRSSDLTLKATLETVYAQPIASLEREWRSFVDTVSLPAKRLVMEADLAQALRRYVPARDYLRAALDQTDRRADSLFFLGELSRASFLTGDYHAAAEYQARLLAVDSAPASGAVALAGYRMMDGDYVSAAAVLESAQRRDTANELLAFNLALSALFRGDSAAAVSGLRKVLVLPGGGGGQIEARIILATLLLTSSQPADRDEATRLGQEALALYQRSPESGRPSPARLLWMGLASLCAGDTGAAGDLLHTALFIESRPFYLGMIDLWLGKLADMQDQRESARYYYNRVAGGLAAAYHQAEARQLLTTGFRQ